MPDSFAVDREAFAALGEASAFEQLVALARSTRVRVTREPLRLRLCGPLLSHHPADPHLASHAERALGVRESGYADFHCSTEAYDLCLEDSWSGYFVARRVSLADPGEPLVIVHLDDHTDMMSTLLTQGDETGAARFDPAEPSSWSAAIDSGAIGIGSFVTALYHLPQPLHVLHLKADHREEPRSVDVCACAERHPLLPSTRFVSIGERRRPADLPLGTYRRDSNPTQLLASMPDGRVIVHVDLDYFVNDYNGNVGSAAQCSVPDGRRRATRLLDTFFAALSQANVVVDRWVIATSPGFCSARHWEWLLDQLSARIDAVTRT